MTMYRFIQRLFAFVVLTGLACGALPAWADEPPPDEFPPPAQPAEAPKAAPPEAAPPKEEGDADTPRPAESAPPLAKPAETAWSPPAVAPAGPGSALPPPQIVRRGPSGARAPLAPGTAPSRSIPTFTPPPPPGGAPTLPRVAPRTPPSTPDLPLVTAPRPPPPALRPGEAMTPPLVPTLPSAPRAFQSADAGSRVFGVSKTHNVALPGGDLALQLDVDYEVLGQDGRDVYVAIWFARVDSGAHIRASMATYADPAGFVTLQTRTARARGQAARFTATLRIPYRAFPVAQANDSYEVEARVQILRDEGAGRASALARGSTSFRVYGTAEPEVAPAPKKDAARNETAP